MVAQLRKTDTEDRIIAAVAALFYRSGLRGVGVDQVIADAGISKSTLYAHFRSKDDLIAEYLRRTDDSWMAQLQEHAVRVGDDPRAQLVGLFGALSDAYDRHGFFGCPFISAGVEAELDSEARAVTMAHARRRNDWLTSLARQAGARSPETLGRQIGLTIDGTLATGRLEQDPSVVDDAKALAAQLVSLAVDR
jgi:AcrR family transcriptional regulator